MLVSLCREAGEGCVWVGSGRSLPCWVEYCFSYSKTKKVSQSFAASVSKFRNIFFAIRRKKMEVFIRNLVQKHDDDVINGHHRDHQSGLDGDDHGVT